MQLPNTAINSLRIRAAREERASAASSIATQLGSMDIAPSGLPPAAILLIRSLSDPQPHLLQVTRPDHGRRNKWQRKLREHVDDLSRHAARPMQGQVPVATDAIVFADECELLACLALHLTANAGHTWWSRAVERYAKHSSASTVLSADLDLLPAVLRRLADWRAAVDVVATIEPQLAVALAQALALHYDLPQIATALATHSDREASTGDFVPTPQRSAEEKQPSLHAATVRIDSTAGLTSSEDGVPLRNPFRRWLPTDLARLAGGQQAFLGLALSIRDGAAELRSPSFARLVACWISALASHHAVETSSEDCGAASQTTATAHEASSIRKQEPSKASDGPDGTITTSVMQSRAPAETGSSDLVERDDQTCAWSSQRDWHSDGTVTELGGVFMLINVLEYLGLPECFEEECRLASSLSAFGTLEGIARVLAGVVGDELRHDPVWAVLAQLDHREPNAPPRAHGLRAPGDELPFAWTEWPQLGSPTVLDDFHADAVEALRRDGWPPELLDWLKLATPYISARIALACGLPDPSHAVRMLLELPARVHVTDAHIDVVAPIESIRVPVRVAGLDRSPGWVRSMQRIVLIHFE